MLFQSYRPGPPLDRFVENFWLYSGYASPHARERILPDGTFKMVFNLRQDEFRIYEPWQPYEFRRYSGAIVSRPSGIPFATDSAEEAHILGVNFRVGGALPFLGRGAAVAGSSHIDLADLWGHEVDRLHQRLVQAPGSSSRFQLLERALLQRLVRGGQHHPAVHVALRLLDAPGQGSRTREIARQVGLSQRRFITVFQQEIGIAPKVFSRTRRFQRALVLTRRAVAPDWSMLALDCGYCDQSHMIRDFRAFSGLSPAEYVSHQRAFAARGLRVKHNHIPLLE